MKSDTIPQILCLYIDVCSPTGCTDPESGVAREMTFKPRHERIVEIWDGRGLGRWWIEFVHHRLVSWNHPKLVFVVTGPISIGKWMVVESWKKVCHALENNTIIMPQGYGFLSFSLTSCEIAFLSIGYERGIRHCEITCFLCIWKQQRQKDSLPVSGTIFLQFLEQRDRSSCQRDLPLKASNYSHMFTVRFPLPSPLLFILRR